MTSLGLGLLLLLVLVLPLSVRWAEEELELFLLLGGIAAVSLSKLWSLELLGKALLEPWTLSLGVLVAGLLFARWRQALVAALLRLEARWGRRWLLFGLVVGLGLLSAVITAIIAALALAEAVSALDLSRKTSVRLVVLACFSIGLGSALSPLGGPLAAIATANLHGAPVNAGFFYLFQLLAVWVLPLILLCGALTFALDLESHEGRLREDGTEGPRAIAVRALKIHLFVTGLILLGAGFKPELDLRLAGVSPAWLYWVNSVSAVLDNATLAAAEISTQWPRAALLHMLLGLLISGGMLIPGNIPNIISANKLGLRPKEWAVFGLPLGIAMMALVFGLLQL